MARRIVVRRVARGFTPRLKADASFVTDVDLAVERALRRAIARAFPDHGILGEEYPAETLVRAAGELSYLDTPAAREIERLLGLAMRAVRGLMRSPPVTAK